MGQLQQPFISKWAKVILKGGRDSYFKVCQCLFQSGAKVGKLLQSGTKCYFKLGQLFQSGVIISKRGITALP